MDKVESESVKPVHVAAMLLEIEALLMNCRAQLLQNRHVRFGELLLESQSKLAAVIIRLLGNDAAPLAELFLAVPSGPQTDPPDVRD